MNKKKIIVIGGSVAAIALLIYAFAKKGGSPAKNMTTAGSPALPVPDGGKGGGAAPPEFPVTAITDEPMPITPYGDRPFDNGGVVYAPPAPPVLQDNTTDTTLVRFVDYAGTPIIPQKGGEQVNTFFS